MTDAILADVESSGIYQIRNLVNGKRYIGSAKCFRVRWGKHLNDLKRGRHHSAYLQRSWKIHGEESFAFEVIELCDESSLIPREQNWMDRLSPEYNVSPTAGNCLGVKHSEETKRKHSLAMRGRKFPEAALKRTGMKRTPEQRARFSEAQKRFYESLTPEQKADRAARIAESNRKRLTGRKQSPEVVAKRSASLMGRVMSEETRNKLSIANKGRKPSRNAIEASIAATKGVKRSEEFKEKCRNRRASEETRRKISESNKGRHVSEETKAKIADAQRGRRLSPEAIAKRTATRRANGGYVVSESTREKIASSMTGRTKSPETRAKLSASKKGKKKHVIDGAIRYL